VLAAVGLLAGLSSSISFASAANALCCADMLVLLLLLPSSLLPSRAGGSCWVSPLLLMVVLGLLLLLLLLWLLLCRCVYRLVALHATTLRPLLSMPGTWQGGVMRRPRVIAEWCGTVRGRCGWFALEVCLGCV
jgi:hypothetical protein